MQYKTTYFKLSTNSEISIDDEEYQFRINKEKLEKDIAELDKDIFSDLKKQMTFEGIAESEFEKQRQRILNGIDTRFKPCRQKLNKLKRLFAIQKNLSNSRWTSEDQEMLNRHLNEVASEGWSLHSTQPIIKGFHKSYISRSLSDTAYGFGHDILEGFVLVWEKE